MSVSGGPKQVAADSATARLQWARANAARYFALFGRPPRSVVRPAWRRPLRLGAGVALVIVIVAATMMVVDAPGVGVAQRVPEWLITTFDEITDFGKSVWILVPIALVLAAIAALASPALPLMSRRVLAAVAVRLGFLFLAVGLPGLCFTAVKRLIGRARPLVEGGADPFIYRPLGWNVEYASLPSGHATDAFAIAMALGALWPRARPVLWTYAVVIAVSRVVLTAHFPSDVMAGAVVGVVGALLVRDWFAARGLAFFLGSDGIARPLPGPSFARMKRVARELIAP
jgi:membrane-associated phospholipid phosphatase